MCSKLAQAIWSRSCSSGSVVSILLHARRSLVVIPVLHRRCGWDDPQTLSPPAPGWSGSSCVVADAQQPVREGLGDRVRQPVLAGAGPEVEVEVGAFDSPEPGRHACNGDDDLMAVVRGRPVSADLPPFVVQGQPEDLVGSGESGGGVVEP